MLWIKSLHIVLVASWFAGLFYLPRIFVNLAMEKDAAATARLLLMARKLFRFMTFIAMPALACGLWLWLVVGIGAGPGVAAREAGHRRAAHRLSRLLRQVAAHVPAWREHALGQVVSDVQRTARARPSRRDIAGGHQALLVSITTRAAESNTAARPFRLSFSSSSCGRSRNAIENRTNLIVIRWQTWTIPSRTSVDPGYKVLAASPADEKQNSRVYCSPIRRSSMRPDRRALFALKVASIYYVNLIVGV